MSPDMIDQPQMKGGICTSDKSYLYFLKIEKYELVTKTWVYF